MARPARKLEPIAPPQPYFVTKRPVDVFDSPPPTPSRDSGFRPIAAVICVLAAAIGGFFAVRALRSDDLVVNMGSDNRISEVEVNDLFGALPGYTYQRIPPEVEGEAQQFIDTFPGTAGIIKDVGFRAVARGGQPVGVIVALSVPPEMMDDPAFREDGFDEVEEAGIKPEKMELAGFQAYSLDFSQGDYALPAGSGVIYFYENTMVFVFGFNEATAHDITEKLIQVAPSV